MNVGILFDTRHCIRNASSLNTDKAPDCYTAKARRKGASMYVCIFINCNFSITKAYFTYKYMNIRRYKKSPNKNNLCT